MLPRPVTRAGGPFVALVARRLTGASDATVRADLISLPRHADRIDGWIADGTLGGERRRTRRTCRSAPECGCC